MRNLPPPAWLKTFEAAARLGGFTAAADELGLTPAAVSQQIRALEARLGYPLFRRLPRGVELTELGQSYLPAVRRAFDELASVTAGLFGVTGGGRPLVVRAPPSFSALCLAPLVAGFRAAHPGIPVRLSSATWAETAPEGGIDVDIRYGDGRWPVEDARRLSAPGSVLVCPPGTGFGSDPLAAIAPLLPQAVHIIGCESFWDGFATAHDLDPATIGRAVSTDSSLAALEMVAAGLGAALISPDLTDPFARAGRVAVAPGLMLEHDQAHYVLLPAQGGLRPEALLFRDWLLAAFKA